MVSTPHRLSPPVEPQVDPYTLAQMGIAMLIDLAQRGEIDPWDVKVIDAIDLHLSKLPLQADASLAHKQANLSQSGQAFLWAAMLVLLKAQSLEQSQTQGEDFDFIEEDLDFEPISTSGLPRNLERHIRRRLTSPPPRTRPVTLQDLIQQLSQIAEKIAKPTARHRPLRGKIMSVKQATQTIVGLAHDENLTEMAALVSEFLVNYTSETELWTLEELVELWSNKFPPAPGQTFGENHDRVGVFWALLLLSAQSKVELHQTDFYQTLTIRRLHEESVEMN
ncbi:ScpA family protein [Chamaesiphon sp. GL140_3_metabinner_50]|uniref:segregation/condensation protein A n=1 Tax=Chamaesiphon sp. GL140_3_metabinner_50 TaxID=2970812 RepID=UPI0025FC03AA|nr:ScpA family protein [Chamaesiphon sp. GL140_3_metabinner_50]